MLALVTSAAAVDAEVQTMIAGGEVHPRTTLQPQQVMPDFPYKQRANYLSLGTQQ